MLKAQSTVAVSTLESLSKQQAKHVAKALHKCKGLPWKRALIVDSTLQHRASLHPENAKRFNHGNGFVIGHQWTTMVLDCCVLAEERHTSSRHDWLLLGEQIAKDIFHPLSELEVLVRIQDHGLHEGLGLLTTRFPNGFDGQAPFP